MTMISEVTSISEMTAARTAVLDEAHVGHIRGAFGTILQGDHGPRESWKHRFQTFLAILGPGLIVMAARPGVRCRPSAAGAGRA
jgi:hypothetical protein